MVSRAVTTTPVATVARSVRGIVRGCLRRETRQGYVLLCIALWSLISFLFTTNFIFSTVTVSGQSMAPTLQPGEKYFLNRWFHRLFPLGYGDLVVMRDRAHADLMVKRVIALPYDTIQLRDGLVYLNGRRLHEPYVADRAPTHPQRLGSRPLRLGPDEYFVMGDNRRVSEDSRTLGPVRRQDLLGLVIGAR